MIDPERHVHRQRALDVLRRRGHPLRELAIQPGRGFGIGRAIRNLLDIPDLSIRLVSEGNKTLGLIDMFEPLMIAR